MTQIKKDHSVSLLYALPFFAIGQNDLEKQFDQIAKNIDGNVGVLAIIIETGGIVSL